MFVRDQDGDIHLLGTGETIALTRQETGEYTLLRMVPGEDEALILAVSTSWEAMRDARERVWKAIQKVKGGSVDFADLAEVQAAPIKLRALPGGGSCGR